MIQVFSDLYLLIKWLIIFVSLILCVSSCDYQHSLQDEWISGTRRDRRKRRFPRCRKNRRTWMTPTARKNPEEPEGIIISISLIEKIPATSRRSPGVSKSFSDQDSSRNSWDKSTHPADSARASRSKNNLGTNSVPTIRGRYSKVRKISRQRKSISLSSSPGENNILEKERKQFHTNTVPTNSTACGNACASSSSNNFVANSSPTVSGGSPKVREISPPKKLISLITIPDENNKSEMKERNQFQTLSEEDLSFLAPVCVFSEKEIVSLGNDILGQRKYNTKIDNLLRVVIAYTISENLSSQLEINDICKQVSGFTNPMKSALNRIPGDSMSARITKFMSDFDKVFFIHGSWVSRKSGAEVWLQTSLSELLKSTLIAFIEGGKKSVSDLSEMLLLTLGEIDIPLFGSVCDNNVNLFISRYKTVFGTAKDSVFLIPGIEKSFGSSVDQRFVKEVSSFFKPILKSSAIPYTVLPFVLSMRNPELLAVLIDRTCEGILALLLKDKAFKCIDGLVFLDGFTPVRQFV